MKHCLKPAALLLGALAATGALAMKPGTYEITTRGHNGPMTVLTTVSENRIEAVRLSDNYETDYIAWEPMARIAEKIVSEQTLSVDAVSGATESSEYFLTAVGKAVEEAGGKIADFTRDLTPPDPALLPARAVETDVLVIGAGPAGLSAALAALESGARVAIIEKTGETGGAARRSAGLIAAAGTGVQKEAGISDSAEAMTAAWLAAQKESVPGGDKAYPRRERVEALARNSAELIDWLAKAGVAFDAPAALTPGGKVLRGHAPKPSAGKTGGEVEIDALEAALRARGVEVILNTPAYRLTLSPSGEVTGALATDGKARLEIRARSTIIASGGFARDIEMLVPRAPEWLMLKDFTSAAPGATGDAIRLGAEAGAAEAADSWVAGRVLRARYAPLEPLFTNESEYADQVIVNERGSRFVREDRPFFADRAARQHAVWAVLDSSDPAKTEVLQKYLTWDVAVHGENWKSLARKMGVPAEALEKNMEAYNAACAAGEDTLLEKAPGHLKAVSKAPFYAVRLFPSSETTLGGLETNDRFETLRADGTVLPGLYAAGEAANRAYYDRVYLPGSGLAVAYASGKAAGEHAAARAAGK